MNPSSMVDSIPNAQEDIEMEMQVPTSMDRVADAVVGALDANANESYSHELGNNPIEAADDAGDDGDLDVLGDGYTADDAQDGEDGQDAEVLQGAQDANVESNWTKSIIPEKKEFNKRNKWVPWLLHTRKELLPYRYFTAIYLEMKYAKKFPIEFWAETDSSSHDYYQRKDDNYHLSRLILRRKLNLGLLRTCRLINAEASEVFYGDNEFRFSGINGQMVANLFMDRIYKRHFQWLKTLTIQMPFHSGGRDGWSAANPDTRRSYEIFSDRLPFSGWYDRKFFYVEAFDHLVRKLTRAVRFEKLTLVLPDYYKQGHQSSWFRDAHADGRGDNLIWDHIETLIVAKPELKIEIIRLEDKDTVFGNDGISEADCWENTKPCEDHARLIKMFKADSNCTVRGAYNDPRGRWSPIEDIEEAVFLPAEEEAEDNIEDDAGDDF